MGSPSEHEAIRIDVPVDLTVLVGVRRQVVDAAHGWGFTALDDLALVATEMITNAIVHAVTPSVATCRRLVDQGIELSVNDHGPGWPSMRSTDDQRTSGRGLHIVDALAASWGVQPERDGSKTIWARLDASSGTPRR